MRAEVARLKARLGDLDEFEAEWRMYADRLRALAVEMTGRGPRDIPAELRPTLNRVEEIRVRIVALGNTKFDSAYFNRTEFTPLTRANLRTHPHDLFERITGPTWFPIPRNKDVVKLNPLEALLGEAQGLIARKREAMKADLRAKELRVAEHERGAVTLRALAEKWLAHVPGAPLRRFLTKALLDHTKKVVGLLLAALLLAGVHKFFPGVEQSVRDWWGRAVPADSSRIQPR